MNKIIDINGLAYFKQQQDLLNDSKFIPAQDFLDENGKILSSKLPADATTIEVATLAEINALFN